MATEFEIDLEAVNPYEFFTRNEPMLNKTEPVIDPATGWRYTYRDIGMTRNAREEHTKEMKVFLDPIPHVVLDQNVPLRGWYKGKHEDGSVRPRPCMTEAVLTQPYGGFCSVGCGFCYINNGTRGYRGQGVATVDPTYPDKIRKQLSKMKIGAAVYMSSFTDPFQELEEFYHNTQKTSQAAIDNGLPIFFLTRKLVPGWAYDHLKVSPYSYMQFSINTSNPQDWLRLSPRGATLETMIDQVHEMHSQGIYVSIQVNPIIAGIIPNEDIVALIHKLAEAGANHLIFKFVEIVYPAVKQLVYQMTQRFGQERGDKFRELFTCNIGGVRTIDEGYRKQSLDLYAVECKKAGVTMSLCYEYEFQRNKDGIIVSSSGVSMGRKYLTADQCHGHRVPMHVREDLSQKFRPLDECPPSGCLYCGDDAGGDDKVPCGSHFLGTARALEPKDYRQWPTSALTKGNVIPLREV